MKSFFASLNLSFKTPLDKLLWVLAILSFGIVIFLALTLDLYYDEAYTYLNSGRLRNFWTIIQFRIANVHPLNSLLIAVTTAFLPYSDFAIRLPALVFAAFYMVLAMAFAKKTSMPFTAFGLLVFFDFLLLFLGIARGYGMCATLLLAMALSYFNKEKVNTWQLVMAWLGVAAIFANYIAIPFVLCFYAMIYAFDLKFKRPSLSKKQGYWLAGLLALGVYGFIIVSLEGKPLYGAYNAGFLESVPKSIYLHFTKLGNPATWVFAIALAFFLALVGFSFFKKRSLSVGLVLIVSFFGVYLLSSLLNKPLPTGRVLLPFWPIFVVALAQLMRVSSSIMNGLFLRAFDVLCCGLLAVNLVSQFNFTELYTGSKNQWLLAVDGLNNPSLKKDVSYRYYEEQAAYYKSLPERLDKKEGKLLVDEDGFNVTQYEALQLMEITTTQDEEIMVIKCYNSGKLLLMDTLVLSAELRHKFKDRNMWIVSAASEVADSMFVFLNQDGLGVGFKSSPAVQYRPLNVIPWEPRPNLDLGRNVPPD